MEVVGGLLALAAVIVVAAYIAQPFFAPRGEGRLGTDRRGVAAQRRRADLFAERNRLYKSIRELDFDHSTDKVSDEDYGEQRYQLVAQGVDILSQLDSLPALDAVEDDAVEQAILKLREGEPLTAADVVAPLAAPAEGAATRFCPQCGTPAEPGDRFCHKCGTPL